MSKVKMCRCALTPHPCLDLRLQSLSIAIPTKFVHLTKSREGHSQGTPKGCFQRNYGHLGCPLRGQTGRVYMYHKIWSIRPPPCAVHLSQIGGGGGALTTNSYKIFRVYAHVPPHLCMESIHLQSNL